MTIKIATLGCCATRDNFNSKIIPQYKDYYSIVLHQNQTSMISLAAEPISYNRSLINHISAFDQRHFETELNKTFLDALIINKPDYLILDFYGDVYYGAREIGNSYITNKRWLFSKTSLYNELPEGKVISPFTNEDIFFTQWKKGVQSLFDFLEKHIPDCKVILNSPRFTDQYIDYETMELRLVSKTENQNSIQIDVYNNWWDKLDQYVLNNYKVHSIDFRDKNYLADQKHLWGLFYLHFEKEFYQDFTHKLVSFIIQDLKQRNSILTSTNQEQQQQVESRNLVYNANFNNGSHYWSHWNKDFTILKSEEESDLPMLTISKKDEQKDLYRQLWSNAIEINGDGEKEFTLSFEFKTDSISTIDSHGFIFSIRALDSHSEYSQSAAKWFKNIRITDLHGLKDGEWFKYSITFKPAAGKFLKVGPYLMRNGTAYWRNISLQLGNVTEDSFSYVNIT